MKIHSQSQVNAAKPVSAVPAPVKKNDPREVAFGTGVPTGKPEDAPAAGGHARLDAFAQKIEKRFENALASKDLTPRQQQALEKERDRFHSMIARFEAAYMDGAEGAKMDKAEGMQKLLENFGKSVGHIVSGGSPDVADDAPAATGHARLDAFTQKVEKRFEHALASKDLSPRQQQALEKERDRFHTMVARFEATYMDGADSAKMDKAEGLQKLMASFTKSVNHIVAGGTDVVENAPKVPYPTAADLGTGRTRGGIDTVG